MASESRQFWWKTPRDPRDLVGQPVPVKGDVWLDTNNQTVYVWLGARWFALAAGPAAESNVGVYTLEYLRHVYPTFNWDNDEDGDAPQARVPVPAPEHYGDF